jgi:small-conductance mechanosensitive channel/CRP-like cAMP-binding protein
MRRVKKLVAALWLPLLLAALFVVASLYQQEILLKLGSATVAQILKYYPYAVGIGIWFSIAYLLNRFLAVAVWEPINRRVPIPRLLRNVMEVIVYVIAITGIVGVVFQKPIGPFWAASGAGAIVVGLALRNVILDIFIGLAVHFDQPFEIGDFIQLANGPSGRVVELNWRTTRLLTGEGNMVVIPNGKLGDIIVTNFSKPEPVGEFEISIFLDFEVPSERALRVLNAAVRSAAGSTGILDDPAPKARIRGVSQQGVEYKIKYYLDPRQAGPGKARHEVWRAILDQLHRAGLQPALAKQDIFNAERPQRQFNTNSHADRITLLSRVELFKGLNPEERSTLAEKMRERSFPEGSHIIKKGEAGSSMFILCEGLLNVMIVLKEGNSESCVARLKAGMFFGEMSMLTGEPRSASILAATDILVFEITKDDVAGLISKRPELAEQISQAVAQRKMRNAQASAQAQTPVQLAEEKSFAAQLTGKILSFLGLKTPAHLTAHQIEENASRSPFA